MARIILVSEYLRGGTQARQLANRTKYFATRPGVELLNDEHANEPATKKQQEYVQRLIRSFPKAKELLEYEDYLQDSTRGSAQNLIDQVQELYIDMLDERENLVDYMANRPGVQTFGEHGLWDANGKVGVLSRAVDEVANHPGIVWTPVISIRREDAERLGYNDAENWRALVNASTCDIAKAYKIHPDHLRWYAAFHRKDNQVHIHMTVFSSDPKEGYLTKQGIRDLKSAFAKQIFQQDLICVYEKKTEHRNRLQRDAQALLSELLEQMKTSSIQNSKLTELVAELAQRLQNTSGKKVYGYLPPICKRLVDSIVDELAKDELIAEAYRLWYEMYDEGCEVYNQKPPEHVPLSQQKEFKPVRNMVIREAVRLIETAAAFGDKDSDDDGTEHNSHREKEADDLLTARYRRAKKLLRQEDAATSEIADAVKELECLCATGVSSAAYQLGKLYLTGEVVEKDVSKAIEYLTAAAEQENQYAQFALGKILLMGNGVQRDREKAVEWLGKASAQGNQYAQFFIDHQDDYLKLGVGDSLIRMLHHMSRIFRENMANGPAFRGMQIDRKRKKELERKRLAMGHKPDDHEDGQHQTM